MKLDPRGQAKAFAAAQITTAAEHAPDETLSRAARSGYRVEGAYLDWVAKQLAGPRGFWFRNDSPMASVVKFEDRRTPNAAAFKALDALDAEIRKMRGIVPPCVVLAQGRVMQFKPNSVEPFRQAVTAQVVTDFWPARTVVVDVPDAGNERNDARDAQLWRAFLKALEHGCEVRDLAGELIERDELFEMLEGPAYLGIRKG